MLKSAFFKHVQWGLCLLALCSWGVKVYATEKRIEKSSASADNVIHIASGEWPPFIGSDLKNYGFVAEIISTAFAAEGYQVQFHFLPWARAYAETQRGLYHATAIWMHSVERENDFYYSQPVSQEEFVFFYPSAKPFEWQSLSDLAPYKLGGVIAYSYGQEMDALIESGVLYMERDGLAAKNLEKLAKGRVEIVPEEKHIGYYLINKEIPHLRQRIAHHPVPFLTNSNYLLFPKQRQDSPALLSIFNRNLPKANSPQSD
ncbi:ABC transporter substrate-binding protein [Vibrio navarrensis]|nr:ABC transporter substrate-binding protein [Vibrio navarrensis]MBE4610951.1 ABC transporter substrate-binding protein [Vibrio navarrensis]